MEEISNFSPNVHFQKDSNMFSIIIFTLVLLGYINACLEGKCRCHEELRVIDCTSLRSMPHATSTLDNYTSILLRDNYLKHLNFTSAFKMLPQVVLLDLRDNNPLLCQDITRLQPSKSIKIISDCKYSSTKIPRYFTSRFQPPTKQNHLRIIRCHLTLNQASQEISLHISLRKSQE